MNKEKIKELAKKIKESVDFKIEITDDIYKGQNKNGIYYTIGYVNERFSLTDPRSTVNRNQKLDFIPKGFTLEIAMNGNVSIQQKL